jgi:hypothetical protein
VSRRGGAALAATAIMVVTVIAACAQKAAETASARATPAQHPAAATSRPASPSGPASVSPAGSPTVAPRPSPSPSASNSYRYANARFGFSLGVPDGYTAQTPPEDGDGLSFRNAAGPATVTAYGDNNVLSHTPSQELAAMASTYQSAGDTVTYRFARGDVVAVSGTTPHGTIFYQREVVYPAVIYALGWTYPIASKSQYDPLVTGTVDSFVPGPAHSG